MACLAYFITWNTYGTWLHGDDRGSVDLDTNLVGTPRVGPDSDRHARMAQRCKRAAWVLSNQMRGVVERGIRDHAARRGWRLIALNVRTNHVHVIVTMCDGYGPEQVMQQFKSWGTRRLIAAGLAASASRVWTDHGSTRYLSDEGSLAAAVEYVLNEQ